MIFLNTSGPIAHGSLILDCLHPGLIAVTTGSLNGIPCTETYFSGIGGVVPKFRAQKNNCEEIASAKQNGAIT